MDFIQLFKTREEYDGCISHFRNQLEDNDEYIVVYEWIIEQLQEAAKQHTYNHELEPLKAEIKQLIRDIVELQGHARSEVTSIDLHHKERGWLYEINQSGSLWGTYPTLIELRDSLIREKTGRISHE